MFCNHCGRPVPDGSDFCPACGAIQERLRDPAPADRHSRRTEPRRQPRPDAERSRAARPRSDWERLEDRPGRAVSTRSKDLWIERDDALGALVRHFHGQRRDRWRAIAIGASVACVASLFLPWFTFSLLGGFEVLDFLNVFADGLRSPDWLVIAIAGVAVIVALYLGHPMGALAGCVVLCYFAVSNTAQLCWSLGFMRPTLGFIAYVLACAVATYGALCAGALEELNLALPAPAPAASYDYGYPDAPGPHIPKSDDRYR